MGRSRTGRYRRRSASLPRLERAGDNIQVTLLPLCLTDTEFCPAGALPACLAAHSPEYVGKGIPCVLRIGEDRIDIPHGPHRPQFPEAD